jgi:hypothetical protein
MRTNARSPAKKKVTINIHAVGFRSRARAGEEARSMLVEFYGSWAVFEEGKRGKKTCDDTRLFWKKVLIGVWSMPSIWK